MNTRNSLLILGVSSLLLAMGCGHSKDDQPAPKPAGAELESVAQNQSWLIGDWHIEGTPTSMGDLGADIRHLHIDATSLWVEKFGHLAAENANFNTEGYDYGGNCLYRVHSTRFGLVPSTGTPEYRGALTFYPDSYELLSDPGNRADCADQIQRINTVNARFAVASNIGVMVKESDGEMAFEPLFEAHQVGELKRYQRQ